MCVLADKALQSHRFVFLKDKMSIIVYFSVLRFNAVHSFLVGKETVVTFLSGIVVFPLFVAAHAATSTCDCALIICPEHRCYFQAPYLDTRDEPLYECSS